jgi:hypothetical protein
MATVVAGRLRDEGLTFDGGGRPGTNRQLSFTRRTSTPAQLNDNISCPVTRKYSGPRPALPADLAGVSDGLPIYGPRLFEPVDPRWRAPDGVGLRPAKRAEQRQRPHNRRRTSIPAWARRAYDVGANQASRLSAPLSIGPLSRTMRSSATDQQRQRVLSDGRGFRSNEWNAPFLCDADFRRHRIQPTTIGRMAFRHFLARRQYFGAGRNPARFHTHPASRLISAAARVARGAPGAFFAGATSF